jgi:two-component system response regulator PilR (NtrC family)
VAVNCSAIPEALLEAEFFGARKGSYTGATQDREGYFQAARSGTLFLDEIGDLPLAMQSKLLRAIQERQVRSLGSTQEDAVDVRIVSATHKDLAADVHAGRFRQDLYYRLNVIEILVPPLRERREDLPALCEALLARIAQESGMPLPVLSPSVVQQLCEHPLGGNVRELENLLHRAVALSDGEELQVDFAPTQAPAAREPAPAALAAAPDGMPPDLQTYLDQQEREILVKALQESGFNRTAAAQRLGLSLRQIRYRIARLAIAAPGGDDANDEHG